MQPFAPNRHRKFLDVGRIRPGDMFLTSEKEIRELCAKLIVAQDPSAFQAALAQVRTAIREHLLEAENRGIHLVLEMQKIPERIKDGTEG